MPTFRISCLPKKGIRDPQGEVVLKALHQLGFEAVRDVRIGKYVDLAVGENVDEQQVDEMCNKMLVNPIMESYRIETSDE